MFPKEVSYCDDILIVWKKMCGFTIFKYFKKMWGFFGYDKNKIELGVKFYFGAQHMKLDDTFVLC